MSVHKHLFCTPSATVPDVALPPPSLESSPCPLDSGSELRSTSSIPGVVPEVEGVKGVYGRTLTYTERVMEQIIRQPAVAGSFYPDDAHELHSMIDGFLLAAQEKNTATGPVPKAIIAPHAGYIYSGPVAASAYVRITAARDQITRVVLFGPSHRVPLQGLAVTNATHFATPLGLIPLDREAINHVMKLPQVQALDQAHAMEHSLEVHLPFLQEVLETFSLVPLVVGDADPEQVAEVLSQLWGESETLIVISSDLSHFHDYDTAHRMDSKTSQAIESLRPEDIHYDDACGRNPVNGLLTLAKEKGLKGKTIDLRNSGDTAGPRDQVVGYGAYLFN